MLEMDSDGSTTAATNRLQCHRRDLTKHLKSYFNNKQTVNDSVKLRHSESR